MKNFKNCVKNTGKIDFLRIFSYFLVIFLVFFNKYDLQISRLLADLAPYQYYSENNFANFFELYGEYVLYFSVGIASLYIIFFVLFLRKKNNKILLKKLFLFALIIIFIGFFSNLITHFFKQFAVTRMRYRAMNFINDFSYYTPFYFSTGQTFAREFTGVNFFYDAFRSFPSGHVTACSVLFSLFLLPVLFPTLPKFFIAVCYAVPILLSAVVGISRIIAGAHFLSDVLAAMIIVLFTVLLARAILYSTYAKNFVSNSSQNI